ncbi:uncharacterized protein K452DRAFT_286661 [Aplosporella prunicola CBS 121167]|uniref:DUF2423 domain-containing protein n=1 Tax=Aplosporella prunicola CBS 121167 TaxID=1176127 RepID=A0A6A6BJP5_9PEZI|nr:uncharacterized protein K452DRAFT_286661 [Aplosporella prunicola CBS 121167]KAF2143037.1 hypothetical protein K452DRAFT_286661 [Aplosporella prunicola CBS 121167]
MAKSSRSSIKKTNNKNLKTRVFGPVENDRTERLSQKLLELAQQPRPAKSEMEVEKDEAAAEAQPDAQADNSEDMELDDANATTKPSMTSLKKKTGRVQKKRRGKPQNTLTFKNFKTGARKSGAGKKGKR